MSETANYVLILFSFHVFINESVSVLLSLCWAITLAILLSFIIEVIKFWS